MCPDRLKKKNNFSKKKIEYIHKPNTLGQDKHMLSKHSMVCTKMVLSNDKRDKYTVIQQKCDLKTDTNMLQYVYAHMHKKREKDNAT